MNVGGGPLLFCVQLITDSNVDTSVLIGQLGSAKTSLNAFGATTLTSYVTAMRDGGWNTRILATPLFPTVPGQPPARTHPWNTKQRSGLTATCRPGHMAATPLRGFVAWLPWQAWPPLKSRR